MSAIEQSLRDRVADILGVPSGKVDSSTPLSGLGLDSLGLLQLTASVESDLCDEWPGGCSDQLTIESLAELLEDRASLAEARPPGLRERMLADSILPPDICPQGAPVRVPRSILLTGATGFLGAYLLSSLLQTTTAGIVCFVRPGREDARKRVRRNLAKYGIWEDRFNDRIQIVEGDLAQPRLGLSALTFDRVADSVDAIMHSAASVNWVQPYSALRLSNVLAVRELLRLACRGKAKPFHFVSTMGVCYSSIGPREIDETGEPFCNKDGIHLAYAQSKLVAEALVRTATERGLPGRIYRPSFISGDSVTGIFNTSEFISTLIKGCVQMSAAPDLDWRLDAVPVDFAGAAISRLALAGSSAMLQVFHLANSKARHWRELILWMNLYGYRVELLPYEDWLARLGRAIVQSDHPLRNLAPFFMQQPTSVPGLYLPNFYEESRKTRVRCTATETALAQQGLECPGLSASLLDRYFSSFIERQFLQAPAQATKAPGVSLRMDSAFFGRVFAPSKVINTVPVALPAGHSVVGELTSWKYGQSIGLHGYRVTLQKSDDESDPVEMDVVVKVKTTDTHVIEVGEAVATLCSGSLGEAYAQFSHLLGLRRSDVRELALYRQSDERVHRHTPTFHGGWADDHQTILVLERLSEMVLMNSAECLDDWRRQHVEAAIDGLAEIHSVWYGLTDSMPDELSVQPYATSAQMLEGRPLWVALAAHARPLFSEWAGAKLAVLQNELIENLDQWWSAGAELPRTLIHNDFNPRNLAFRPGGTRLRLCVYDWELATTGLPQHDLAELLCFVLGPEIKIGDVHPYIERHRIALERASGNIIDKESWLQGFRFSLCDLMINRLPAYAMINRFRKQNFLEHAVRSWMTLYESL